MDETIVSQAGADVIDGEDGFDTLTYAGSDAGVRITQFNSGLGGHAEGDSIANIERIIGSAFDDRVDFGTSGGPTVEFFGEEGDDFFNLGDHRFPTSVALTFEGGNGADMLSIHTGIDNLAADGTPSAFAGSVFRGGDDTNTDTLLIRGSGAIDFRVVTLESFERMIFAGNVESYDVTFTASQFEQFNNIAFGRRGDLDFNIHMEDQLALDISGFGGESLNRSPQDFHIFGDSDAENIIASRSSDEIFGNGGKDTIDGGLGGDIIDGGKSGDLIDGGLGDDSILGQSGNDNLSGGEGRDTLRGGTGEDTIDGGDDQDLITGAKGKDVLNGGAGKDKINGGSSGDTIDGGSAADEISGGSGKDFILGGSGNDTIDGDGGADTIDGGSGADVINGGSSADVINGGSAGDVIDGGTGFDTINGGTGADTIVGGSGEDLINGEGGDDFLTGGVGSDTFVFAGDFGDDTITDFDASDNAEEIDLSAIAGITDFADLSENHMFALEGGVVIDTLDGSTISLFNVGINDLNNTDFIFADIA